MDTTGPWTRAAAAAGLLDGDQGLPTIFAQVSARAAALGALNLGQGFPDDDPPAPVAQAAIDAIRAGRNQYPPGPGDPDLRAAIAEHQSSWYGLDWDPADEVLVTSGATEALAATFLALLRPGDEVITLEPFYDQYAALVGLTGAVHRTVPLAVGTAATDGDLRLTVDEDALRAAFGERTRLVVVNTPHNPTGILLEESTMRVIVEEATAHDALIVTDEVYEHLTFSAPHRPPATLPGARERTVSISSAGKTFSATGWKIGWVTAPRELVSAIMSAKQWLTYTSGAPFQPAVAAGLRMDRSAFAERSAELRARRDLLTDGLRGIGFRVSVPEAGYFTVADASPLGEPDAAALAERLPAEAGVAAIPLSALCRAEDAGRFSSVLRFAFCKSPETIEQALERLDAWAAPRR